MSAVLQVPIPDEEALSTSQLRKKSPPGASADNPLELLQSVIARLNAPSSETADQTKITNLLAEVKQALERASVVSGAVAESEEFDRQGLFENAINALDKGLDAYPGDPALLVRRTDLEQRQRASQAAATAELALQEVEWLVGQNRLDLAATFLREKATVLPDQPGLISRLKEIEAELPQWTEDRRLQSALGRVAALEDLQQWQVALTVVDEALRSNTASPEWAEEARRIRNRLADHEHQTRLARRVDLIRQKISAGLWKQASNLVESAQKEFSGVPELDALRREVGAGLKRAECDDVVAEVRQCLADGDLENAEQILRRGMRALGRESALNGLQKELQAEKLYRDELRTAQILFGRRQFAEAERILSGPAFADRSESRTLLDAIRQARAESEEENFLDRGREKCLKLMEQHQYAQAIDVLRNLQALFPGNPILERDLAAAQAALAKEPPKTVEVFGKNDLASEAAGASEAPRFAIFQQHLPDAGSFSEPAGPRRSFRIKAAFAVAASIGLASAGVFWEMNTGSRQELTPPSAPAAPRPPALTPTAAPEPPAASVSSNDVSAAEPAPPAKVAESKPKPATESGSVQSAAVEKPEIPLVRPAKQFIPAPARAAVVRIPVVPPPADLVTADSVGSAPVGLIGALNANASLPSARQQSPAPASNPAPRPSPAKTVFQDAQLISRILPPFPPMALQMRVAGQVEIDATIDEHGTVTGTRAVKGNALLASAAIEAVKKWKYKAATADGKPVASTVRIKVDFNAGTGK